MFLIHSFQEHIGKLITNEFALTAAIIFSFISSLLYRIFVIIFLRLMYITVYNRANQRISGGFKGGRWGGGPLLAHIFVKKPLFPRKRHIFRCAHLR